MKGTLFSSDFVKDGAGDLKMLEINTDTACIDNLSSNIDFTAFYQTLSDNSLTDLQVIYKEMQEPIIARLEAQKPGGVTITKHKEQRSTVFPTLKEIHYEIHYAIKARMIVYFCFEMDLNDRVHCLLLRKSDS